MDLLTSAILRQNNIQASQKREVIDARPISTQNLVRPARPQKSHLVNEPFYKAPENFVKDINQNLHNIKKGLTGKGNDHDLGRINDFAMKAGALGLAAYLFTKARTPMSKTMELVGFGSFFASMALWPKLFIETPLRAMYGLNIHQKYVDNEGRKKMFFQDPQYVPWNLYNDKQLDKLGNRLGVPKNIHNRNEVIKDKAHKIALQGNTLWMLTAGFATPLMSALICNQAEKYIQPALDKARIDRKIKQLEDAEFIARKRSVKYDDTLRSLDEILTFNQSSGFKKRDINKIINMIAQDETTHGKKAIKAQVNSMFREKEDVSALENFVKSAAAKPIKQLGLTTDKVLKLMQGKDIGDLRTTLVDEIGLGSLNDKIDDILDDLETQAKNIENDKPIVLQPVYELIDDGAMYIKRLARAFFGYITHKEVIKETEDMLLSDRAETFKANSWIKCSKVFCQNLGLNSQETKGVKDGGPEAIAIIMKKLDRLSASPARYEKALKQLVKSIHEFDRQLLPLNKDGEVQGIQAALERSYERVLHKYIVEFRSIYDKDVNPVFEPMLDYLRGAEDLAQGGQRDFIMRNLGGRIEEMRMNIYHLLHVMDVFKRINSSGFEEIFLQYCKDKNIRCSANEVKTFISEVKQAMILGTGADHTTKFGLLNPEQPLYQRFMDFVYKEPLDDITVRAMQGKKVGKEAMESSFAKFLDESYKYIGGYQYAHEASVTTNGINSGNHSLRSKFVGPRIDKVIGEVSSQVFNSSKWLKMFGGMAVILAGVTLLAETSFGRVSTKEVKHKKGQN